MATDILQWNIRGLRPQYAELSLLLADHNPNVVCLQETKLPADSSFSVKGYSSYHHIHSENQIACGGSSILIKNNGIHKKLNIVSNLQAVAVRVTLHKPVTVCSLYLPPSQPLNLNDLKGLLEQLPSPYILVGDFNAHSKLWGNTSCPRGKIVEDLLLQTNICLLNDISPTYVSPSTLNTSSIDLSLCDPDLFSHFSWSVLDDPHGSNHFPILLKPEIPTKTSLPQQWNFKKADWPSFLADCELLLNRQSAGHSYDHFLEVLLSICDKHIPKTSPKAKKNKVWFTEECRKAVGAKKQAYRKFAKTHNAEDLRKFKIARAVARRTIRESKRTSFRKYVSKINNRTPMTKIWKIVKKLRGTHTNDCIKHVQKLDNTSAETELDISNTLAQTLEKNSSSEHYTPKFKSNKAKSENKPVNFSSSEHFDYNLPFSLKELKLRVSELSNTAPGPDQIHNEILKHLPDETLQALLDIFNHFWTTQTFPDEWHQATIIPIPKPSKDHTNPSNYRPIALTSCLCKLMEKLVNARLMWYLETENDLSNLQCGFRKNRSTVDHLVRLESFIREGFLKGEHLVAVFFDLEKAFDTTWKHGILKDLHDLGLRGHLPMFIKNFLNNRFFRVKVGSTLSDPHHQEEGVPQGSILSPILFEIKINSIINTLRAGTDCSLYVDDFLVCYKTKAGIETAERQLQLQLNKLQEWADLNGFKFSPSKTVAVHFCNRKKCIRDPDLYLYGTRIPVKEETRFLGLIFDKKLTFLPHIRDLRLRCQNALNALKVLSSPEWGGTSDILLNLYRALIRSKLDYASFIYGSARQSYLKILDPIHHQGLRLALGAFRTSPVDSLLAEADEPPLRLRRKRLGLQYALKIKSTPTSPTFDCLYNTPMETIEKFQKHPNKIPPFGIRVREDLDDFDLSDEDVSEFRFSSIPPWKLDRVKIDLDLSKFLKSQTSEKEFLKAFNELNKKYPQHFQIFTDGSKDETAVGAAAYSDSSSSQERLGPCASIFTAEATALKMALDLIEKSPQKSFIVFSDSLSCLQSLQMSNISDMRILVLAERIHSLAQHKDIVFAWVPSHVGIHGNECADRLAKEASASDTPNYGPIPHTDLRVAVRKGTRNIWNNYWSVQTGNKLNKIMPEQRSRKAPSLPRIYESLLTRLRIGHSPFTHSYLLTGEPPPVCVGCDQLMSVEHILIDCVDFDVSRKKFFKTKSLKLLFDLVEPDKIVSFIKEIGLVRKM